MAVVAGHGPVQCSVLILMLLGHRAPRRAEAKAAREAAAEVARLQEEAHAADQAAARISGFIAQAPSNSERRVILMPDGITFCVCKDGDDKAMRGMFDMGEAMPARELASLLVPRAREAIACLRAAQKAAGEDAASDSSEEQQPQQPWGSDSSGGSQEDRPWWEGRSGGGGGLGKQGSFGRSGGGEDRSWADAFFGGGGSSTEAPRAQDCCFESDSSAHDPFWAQAFGGSSTSSKQLSSVEELLMGMGFHVEEVAPETFAATRAGGPCSGSTTASSAAGTSSCTEAAAEDVSCSGEPKKLQQQEQPADGVINAAEPEQELVGSTLVAGEDGTEPEEQTAAQSMAASSRGKTMLAPEQPQQQHAEAKPEQSTSLTAPTAAAKQDSAEASSTAAEGRSTPAPGTSPGARGSPSRAHRTYGRCCQETLHGCSDVRRNGSVGRCQHVQGHTHLSASLRAQDRPGTH